MSQEGDIADLTRYGYNTSYCSPPVAGLGWTMDERNTPSCRQTVFQAHTSFFISFPEVIHALPLLLLLHCRHTMMVSSIRPFLCFQAWLTSLLIVNPSSHFFVNSLIPLTTLRVVASSSSSTTTATTLYQTTPPAASPSSATTNTSMKLVKGVRDIVDDYDVFLLDMWGVMHDGHKPYDGVLDVVQQLKKAGKKLIILSNSSKRMDNSVKMLKKLGFDPMNDFDQIYTSGEVAFHMLSGDSDAAPKWDLMAKAINHKKCFVLGSGDGDEEYCASAGWSLTSIDEAELVVARGVFTINDGNSVVHKRQDTELYESILQKRLKQAATRQLPMLVCNPDKIRPDKERPPMPGKIGDAYEEALGGGPEAATFVKRVGKPIADVYDLALKQTTDRSRVCMVGDALETDVTGGNIAGIASLWVLKDGVYSPDLVDVESLEAGAQTLLESFNQMEGTYAAGRQIFPEMIIPHFRW